MFIVSPDSFKVHTRPRKDVESYQESTIGLDLPLNMEFISRLTLLDSYKG